MSALLETLPKGWWSSSLPNYREANGTYELFDYDALPPLTQALDDSFAWLLSEPVWENAFGDGSQPDLTKLDDILARPEIRLPDSFVIFIQSVELHRRVRSCTDCYLDLADRPVKARGVEDGFLIHFLSDSQWCLHWYLLITQSGAHCVVASTEAYGFLDADDPADPLNREVIEVAQEPLFFCAPTFTEFIYRFWLENEIWFALAWDEQPLTPVQQNYVNHYGP